MGTFTSLDFIVLAVLLVIIAIQCYNVIKNSKEVEKDIKPMSKDDFNKMCLNEYFFKKYFAQTL